MVSSMVTSVPRLLAGGTETTRFSYLPFAQAAAASWCESAENSSWSSRLISYFSRSCSVASPRETVHSPGMAGLTRRQPRVVFASSRLAIGKGRSVLGSTHGARLMDSTPPTSTSSASSVLTWREAAMAASSEEPQRRFMVVPGMRGGQAREQGGHAGHVAVFLAGAVGVAEDRFVDSFRVQLRGAGHEFADHVRGEVVGAVPGKASADLAEGRADRVVEVRLLHDVGSRLPDQNVRIVNFRSLNELYQQWRVGFKGFASSKPTRWWPRFHPARRPPTPFAATGCLQWIHGQFPERGFDARSPRADPRLL